METTHTRSSHPVMETPTLDHLIETTTPDHIPPSVMETVHTHFAQQWKQPIRISLLAFRDGNAHPK